MRNFFSALILVLGLAVVPAAAHASPVTYDLNLINLAGNVAGGTGSFTIDDTPKPFADIFFQNGAAGSDLTDLSLTIGGNTFTLADSQALASVTFFLGQVSGVNYAGTLGNGFFKITLDSAGLGYVYTDLLDGEFSAGLIHASPSAAPTPEPSSLLLFGTGALGLAAFGARKFAA
ncbi:MAG TPA: PEP-CTERM sorting domain-containing protein [Edaphobacter sp.]|nr:PEP-CTERM sorting domain-containing protein [Edaphobacter sp.]